MTRLEMVEKLREKTGISYDAAREALEQNNWDLIDTIIVLDKQGRVVEDAGAPRAEEEPKPVRMIDATKAGTKLKNALRWVLGIIKKGEAIRISILRGEEELGSLSVTAVVLLFLVKWYIPLGLWIISLFFGFKYRFGGLAAAGKLLDSLSDRAGEKAEEIKTKFSEDK